MVTSPELEKNLTEMATKGHLVTRTERNAYLKISYKGTGNLISDKWNIKIYTSGALVCNDKDVLEKIRNGSLAAPDPSFKVLQIDDAGIGFPLLGVLIGVSDGKEVRTRAVPVEYFQSPLYDKKSYLGVYAKKGMEILDLIGADPKTHRIEICSGDINKNLKEWLRRKGYDVRITEIKGLLQDSLEHLYGDYIKNTLGKDLAYDPKELNGKNLGIRYYQVVNWAKANAPQYLKNGWKALRA